MSDPLHILIVEGCVAKAEHMVHALQQTEFVSVWQTIESQEVLLAPLNGRSDRIPADHTLPKFNALQALQLLQAHNLHIPYIIVTGPMEKVAFEQAGHYLLKRQPIRLDGEISEAFNEQKIYREKQQVETALRESEARYRHLYATLQKRNREISLLYEAGKELGRTLNLEEIYKTVYGVISSVMDCDTLIVSAYDAQQALIRCLHSCHKGHRQDVSGFPVLALEPEGFGTQSMAIRTGESLIINDYVNRVKRLSGCDYVDEAGIAGHMVSEEADVTRAALIVPLKLENHVVGVVQVQSCRRNAFTEDNLSILEALAPQIAIAIQNAQLYAAEQRRRQVEETLRNASAVLNSTLALDELLERILEQLGKAIPHDSASVQSREGDDLVVRAVEGFERPERLINIKIPIDPKYPNWTVMDRQKPLALEDVPQLYPHFSSEAEYFGTARIRSWLGVPMTVNGRTIGMITIDRTEVRPYNQEEIDLATTFANHAAIAMENAKLYRALESYSNSLEEAVVARTAALQRTTEQVEAILNNSPDAILLLNNSGLVETANRAFHQMFGYQKDDICRQLAVCLVTAAYGEIFSEAFRTARDQGRMSRLEMVAQRQDGTTFDVDVALGAIRENEHVLGVVCSLRDISALKEVERMKDAFVANVSHELRTPITGLKLYHDLIRRNPQKQAVYMERLAREIDRLTYIIEDLLRLSRLDQERITLEMKEVYLSQLARQFVTDRMPLAQNRQLTLVYRPAMPLPVIPADPGLLNQALNILFTNALNYTPAGGVITVGVETRWLDGQPWQGLSVHDTGPGIAPDEQLHIFDRFFRGTLGRETGTPGTGLGLSIAAEIMQRHHGRLDVYSEGVPGKGATFVAWLPANA